VNSIETKPCKITCIDWCSFRYCMSLNMVSRSYSHDHVSSIIMTLERNAWPSLLNLCGLYQCQWLAETLLFLLDHQQGEPIWYMDLKQITNENFLLTIHHHFVIISWFYILILHILLMMGFSFLIPLKLIIFFYFFLPLICFKRI